MELIKLTFQNINALAGTWTIDFRALAEEAGGLFAIVGPTGSGKTSLLDAISLALFGTTPRSSATKEDTIQRGQSVKPCITKGYAQAMAELTFLHDGHEYCTRYTLHNSGSHEFLLKVDGVAQDYTPKEAFRKVQEILCMDYATFSRTILLAQGRFNKFLAAKSEDRLETLSTIAGVGDYQRIADALKVRLSKNSKELEAQQSKAAWSAGQLLPEDELQEKQESLASLSEALKASKQRKAELEPKLQQWREVCALRQEVTHLASTLPELRQLADKCVAAEQEALRKRDALNMESQRTRLMAAQVAEQARDRTAGALQEAERTFTTRREAAQEAEARVTHLQSQETEAMEAQAKRLAWLQAHASDQGLAEALPELRAMANDVRRQRMTAESQQRVTSSAEERVKRAQETLETANEMLKTAHAQELQAQEALEKARETLTVRNAELSTQEQAGEAFMNARWQDAAQAEEAEEAWTAHRAALSPNAPCPLCGSKAHPYVDTPEVLAKHQAWIAQWKAQQSALKQAQSALVKAQKAEHQASASALSAQNDAKLAEDRVRTSQETLEKAAREAAEAQSLLKQFLDMQEKVQQTFRQSLRKWIDLPDEHTSKVPPALEERRKRYAEIHQAAQDDLKAREPLRKLLDEAKQSLAVARAQAEDAEAVRQKALEAHATAQKAFEAFDCVHPKATLEDLEKHFHALSDACDAARNATLQTLSEFRSAQNTLEEKTRTLQAKSEGLPDAEEAETLAQELTALDARLQSLMRQEWDLRRDLEDDAKRRSEHATQQKHLETLQIENSRWTSLEKFLDHNALKKVAQNLLLVRLLEIANNRLRHLLPRYTLRAEERFAEKNAKDPGASPIRALEIMVEDAWLGGERRPTTNLSGGESFLISLVLAISLSDLSAHHLRLKNLFLDEGFGTLDGDCLQRALAILENLHAEGRLVGIISHVEQLKRAPVRIDLHPSSSVSGFSTLTCSVNDEVRPEIVFGDTSHAGTGNRSKYRSTPTAKATPSPEDPPTT